jgi:Zn-dependent protease
MFSQHDLLLRVMFLIPSLLSLSVHEWAHAWAALKLGDDTALRNGRLTLNPIAHIDPLGTLLLPLLGVPFGWAKPVPVNPLRFNRSVSMRTGMAITAAAGPISNFVLVVLCTVVLGLWLRARPDEAIVPGAGVFLLLRGITLNLSLGLFNLLPVPPLDGSRIAHRFIAHRFPRFWDALERHSRVMLVVAFLAAGRLLAGPIELAESGLFRVVFALAGA